jgi:hypothetical protein
MKEVTAKTLEFSGKPSNRDFFHVLFSAATGDSGPGMDEHGPRRK